MLVMKEAIVNSVNVLNFIIVPMELRTAIFTVFHVNPLGAHFSVYYTMHIIRLQFH